MDYKLKSIAVATLLLCHALLSDGQNETVKMTFLGVRHFNSETGDARYQCHISESNSIAQTARVESFRTVWTRNDAYENVDPPAPVWSGAIPHWRINLDNHGNNDSFGVFGCEAALDGKINTSISGIFMRSDADVVPSDELFSMTVNVGEIVSIAMKSTGSKAVSDFRWLKDNVRNNNFHGEDTWSISGPVEMDDAGVYECHIVNERSNAKQGLKLLIVRACPAYRWGRDECLDICDNCYNGGICDEISGKCICAPGFNGTNCEEVCGGNRYGDICEKQCSSTDLPDKCSKHLFCLSHPFGCRCNTGWKGLDCLSACDTGTFGASCLQTCHCQSGQCDRYTGVCIGPPSDCSSGWTGSNCQECEGARFGVDCADGCHCSKGYCNQVTGECSGHCNPEWVELFPPNLCQTGLIDAAYTRKNPGVTVPVTCTAAKGPSSSNIEELDFVLSRHHEHLDSNGISPGEVTFNATTKSTSFMVDDVIDGQNIICELRKDGNKYAGYNITIHLYDLPVLQSAPRADRVTASTVTISWSAWDEETEAGDPPILGYTPYHKMASGQNWVSGLFTSTMSLNYTFKSLFPGNSYSFSVAAVREGDRGEGARSPELNVTTICEAPSSGPKDIQASISGERQENVEISWQLPSDEEIYCSSGLSKFTIYCSSNEMVPADQGTKDILDPTATSHIFENLMVGTTYTFRMSMTTAGGESPLTDGENHFIPILPALSNGGEVETYTCDSITITWNKWQEGVDEGTPPIIGYVPYHKSATKETWFANDMVSHDIGNDDLKLNFQYVDLINNNLYQLAIVAVRGGYGGEGDIGFILYQKTTSSCEKSSLGLVVGVPITFVMLILLAVFALFIVKRIRLQKKSDVGESMSDIRGLKGHASTATENTGNIADNSIGLHCNPNEGYEVVNSPRNQSAYEEPSLDLQKNIRNKDVKPTESLSDEYQNNTVTDARSRQRPMSVSTFSAFMKSPKAKEEILKDLNTLEGLTPEVDVRTLLGAASANSFKNRFPGIIPMDKYRPLLKSLSLAGGNDYANACKVDIGNQRQNVIMTQAPLPETIEDFWRLVFDYKCHTIIMLNEATAEDRKVVKYWPDVEDVQSGAMTISIILMEKKVKYIIRHFDVTHQSFSESIRVKHFAYNNWPRRDGNLSPLVNFIAEIGLGSNGTTLLHCIDGAGRSGIYATMAAEISRIQKTQTIKLFETLKNIRKQNPYAVMAQEEYMMCHRILYYYVTEMQAYDEIEGFKST